MNLDEIIKYLSEKPYCLKMGAGNLAKRLHTDRDTVYKAKTYVREQHDTDKKNLKILIFDLERTPMKAYVWERWKQNISLDQTISESIILSYSAKWLLADEIYSEVLTPAELDDMSDYRLVKSLWSLINEADIVIAYNGNHADIPWIKSRFLCYNMPPTKPFISIDPYETVRKQFGFSSNKMDAIASYLNIANKLDTNFNLWKRCMECDVEALNYMQRYNIMDVKILEEIYLKMRPYIKNHPNIGNILDLDVCPACGCENVEKLDGQYYYTSVNKYQLYRCMDCGSVFRSRKSEGTNTTVVQCAH